jgi:preprotein translocase subunit SecF
LGDILHERTNFQFIERSWRWGIFSGLLLLVSVASLGLNGLNRSIDFTGGISRTVRVEGTAPPIEDVRDALRPLGQPGAKITLLRDRTTGVESIVVQFDEVPPEERREITAALAEFGQIVERTEVSATWGATVTEKALVALAVFFALIAAYLTFRFEFKMAIAALAAVVHDIIITAGVYSVLGFEVAPSTVIAFLTILGFSLYDTVVVFDKVSENTPSVGAERGDTYSLMVNRSMNQVLMRSLNTSFVALLPVASLIIVGTVLFGATTIQTFALALLVGLAIGAYSSIFVATPLLAWMKEHEPRYRALRERSAAQLARGDVPSPSTSTSSIAPDAPSGAGVAAARPPNAVTPRPRQQRRKRRR